MDILPLVAADVFFHAVVSHTLDPPCCRCRLDVIVCKDRRPEVSTRPEVRMYCYNCPLA